MRHSRFLMGFFRDMSSTPQAWVHHKRNYDDVEKEVMLSVAIDIGEPFHVSLHLNVRCSRGLLGSYGIVWGPLPAGLPCTAGSD